ncbi:hypothetical protein UCRPA7_7323 [Phaeoacremonium minimum UCRPA7]|uniref:Uncharacterized protein n=1 Tax=Phaeoacremonium minimum (strain UCR-PA7) TaxID=1286976 RepID=R8BD52_PHAM7|nr:hypothetical protein UCRPA7_7323 [Phaeoacremonium minimum UCRPA7]EON97217.1 hypothetical protein UCRPA7_7323 [Phaeoacremonium minimum UCRPA7]
MGPQTDRSDIIISIHPEHVERIAAGTKNHEFRDYRIPQTVSRIWIYVTKPVCELQYMAIISEAKQPGEINDEKGVGNAEFNKGKMSKFAYELQQVYQLNNPVSIETMKENGWVGAPPQKYIYVPPAVVGQLMGNLRCALFFDEHDQHDVGISVSQEVEMQLRSDITHATQLLSSDGIEMVPSSQEPTPRQNNSHSKPESFAKPMLPVKSGPTTRSQATPTKRNNDTFIRPSQATTVSEVSSPPPAQTPEKSSVPRRPQPCSSVPTLPDDLDADVDVDESPIALRLPQGQGQGQFSIGSSQVLLQDSLINDDDVRRPPVGWESDGE